MRILIEEYQYNVSDVHDVLYGIDAMENVEGKVSIHYVGYYYNPLLGDCVFILPKVLLRDVDGKELAFGKYQPYDIINPEGQEKLTKEERDFLYGFAVWIYRAIVVYKNDKSNDSTIVYQKMINQVGGSSKRKSNTFLDILLSLIQFNKDNKSFFFFVLKNLHSGLNKINWTRTISTTPARPEYRKMPPSSFRLRKGNNERTHRLTKKNLGSPLQRRAELPDTRR
jgi:hypothetical protein